MPATGIDTLVRVLVVDDHPAAARLFETVLAFEGFVPRCIPDALTAYEFARCARRDLMLIDVVMPETSGLELTRWVREDADLAHIPVVLCSSHTMQDMPEIRDSGCDAFIGKPVDICQLGNYLRQVLVKTRPRVLRARSAAPSANPGRVSRPTS